MIAIDKDQLISEIKAHAQKLDSGRNTPTNTAYQLAHTHLIELVEWLAEYDGITLPDR